ncbi:MAG: flagellar biosynthesis anti-sigma factor FlgM [Treponema sp.]|nr:flagellar biosynthesis anti-sigma factor FlgM [Treponema sp.]MBR1715666.1 flagellar biosynthesis anti-sigma factor FlgM [Treponema sp.]
MMSIKLDTVGGINPLNNVQNAHHANNKMPGVSVRDSISVSAEAVSAAEAYYLDQVADETPDVRSDLIASIKEKIKDPNYLSPERIASTADSLMMAWGL